MWLYSSTSSRGWAPARRRCGSTCAGTARRAPRGSASTTATTPAPWPCPCPSPTSTSCCPSTSPSPTCGCSPRPAGIWRRRGCSGGCWTSPVPRDREAVAGSRPVGSRSAGPASPALWRPSSAARAARCQASRWSWRAPGTACRWSRRGLLQGSTWRGPEPPPARPFEPPLGFPFGCVNLKHWMEAGWGRGCRRVGAPPSFSFSSSSSPSGPPLCGCHRVVSCCPVVGPLHPPPPSML